MLKLRHVVFSLALGAFAFGAQSASAIALIDNIPNSGGVGASTYGDRVMLPNDDGSSSLLSMPFSVNFFGNTYNQFYINNNGNLTFAGPLFNYTPISFPISSLPMIAPFWGDVDTRNQSVPFPGNNVYVGSPNPNTIVATWSDVGYYSQHNNLLNDFQAVLINRSDIGPGDFDIEFRYNQLQWTTGDASGGTGGFGGTPAQAGYDAGDLTHYFTLPGSQTNSVLNLANTSNVSVTTPGLWLMSIRNGTTATGAFPWAPLLPQIVTQNGWHFDFDIVLNQRIYIDPMIAVGYDYIVSSGPNFASVLLPAVAGDTDGYDIYLYNMVSGLFDIFFSHADPLVELFFGPGGVDRFAVRDIDVGLDPGDPTAFVTGLTFVDLGRVSMVQTPFTIDDAGQVDVPEPSSIALLLSGLAFWLLLRVPRRAPN